MINIRDYEQVPIRVAAFVRPVTMYHVGYLSTNTQWLAGNLESPSVSEEQFTGYTLIYDLVYRVLIVYSKDNPELLLRIIPAENILQMEFEIDETDTQPV
jgi:hypothetical protein